MNTTDQASPLEPELEQLAVACGLQTGFYDRAGKLVTSSPGAVRAVLTALGYPVNTPAEVATSVQLRENHDWLHIVPPATVVVAGAELTIPVHVPHGAEVQVELTLEDGQRQTLSQVDVYVPPRQIGDSLVGRATFQIPRDLPLGYHLVEASFTGGRGRGYVIVTPSQIPLPGWIPVQRPWGFLAQLYALRSDRSWGLGDYADLADLCSLAKFKAGADFLWVNPVHATEVAPPIEPSPYLPTSRRFLSPLYIRVESIPEYAYLPSQVQAVIEWEAEGGRKANHTDDLLDRDSVWLAKLSALQQVFQAERSAGREAQFQSFCLHQGQALVDFATWCAISAAYAGESWPEHLAQPNSSAVDQWRDAHATEVLFYAWLQWIADEQLGQAQQAARNAGMRIGLITELVAGAQPTGAETWALSHALVPGVRLGTPPDEEDQLDQSWSQVPWHPRGLAELGFMPYRDMLHAVFRRAGAVRVNHVRGLFRQWWVPEGFPAHDGVYVEMPHAEMVGILALEATRAGALVIGDDLGSTGEWTTTYLSGRGIIGTNSLLLEAERVGTLPAPESLPAASLISVTSPGLTPTLTMLEGEHQDPASNSGQSTSAHDGHAVPIEREQEGMFKQLQLFGLLPEQYSAEEVVQALHRYARRTPAWLTAIALTDAVGERRSQKHSGNQAQQSNWQVPLTDANGVPVLLDQLFDHPRLLRLLKAIATERG